MRGAPFRVYRHPNQKHFGEADGSAPDGYVATVAKLIPAEVVAAYLAGRSLIQAAAATGIAWWIGWSLFCLVMVVVIRAWMTSDKREEVPPEWAAVVVAGISFCVWVYSFGDVFMQLNIWSQLLAGLLMIGWTLAAPAVLKLLKQILPG